MMACKAVVLRTLDILISVSWVSHLVVCCWRGTWNLLDLYVLPGDNITGSWISYFAGITICAVVKSSYVSLHRHITDEQKALKIIMSRFMMYIGTWGTIGQWRGIWNLLDLHSDTYWQSNLCVLVVTLFLMWFFKCSVNTLGPPFAMVYDFRRDVFVSTPRLRTSPSRYWDFVVDHVLSQFIVESLVVSMWRSFWNILNDVVFPENFWYSNLVTWGAGIVMTILLLAIEIPVAYISTTARRCGFGCKLLIENIYTLACFVSVVCLWRGWWNILEVYLLPDKLYGGIICHCVGVLLLMCSGAASALFNPTVSIDGECRRGIHWEIEYLEKIFDTKDKGQKNIIEHNNNENDNLLKLPRNGNYIKCAPEVEVEDLKLTSI